MAWADSDEERGRYTTKGKFNAMLVAAEMRGIEFDITVEFTDELFDLQARKCALTGRTLDPGGGRFKGGVKLPQAERTMSLDRIDPQRGYIADNVQWVHKHVNMAKQCMDQGEFVSMCMHVAKHHGMVVP